jgi:polysaccharide biosynthesis protein PslG
VWQNAGMRLKTPVILAASLTLIAGLGGISAVQAAPTSQPGQPIAKGTTISRDLFGMHVAGAQNGVWPTIPFGSLRIWDKDTAWSHIEKTPGTFDWTKLDFIVDNAQKNGVSDLMFVLAGTPTWASTTPTSTGHPGQFPGEQGMPTDIALWDRWVEAVVTRYKGRITSYQPWNEANLQTFFNGTPAQMAELTKRTYDIVQRVDPAAKVIAPSTGTRLGGPFRSFYPRYLNELAKRNWPVDAFAAHTYPASLGTPVTRQALAREWAQMLRTAGAPNLPLYDTEINFGLAGPGAANPYQSITGKKAQDWAALAYLDSLRLGISRAYWYYWSANDTSLLGIQMTPTAPAAKAVATLQDWIVGTTFRGCTAKKNGAVTCTFAKNGKRFQVVWAERGSRNFKGLKNARQTCNLNNVCTPLKANKRIRATGPVYLGP